MTLKKKMQEALTPSQQEDVLKRLARLAEEPGEVGYGARMMRYILCDEDPEPMEVTP